MTLSKFFRSLFGKRRPARRGYAPRIESLEDRRLLSGVGKQQFLGSNLRHHGVILDFPPPVSELATRPLSPSLATIALNSAASVALNFPSRTH